MDSEIHMSGPVCLIENNNLQLKVNQKALKILSTISQPVVVVAIVGLYRTGKSYLMNKLAGKKGGFCLGSTVQSQTKGIWMWCVPHPKKPDYTLVLLDTEGLGDVEKGDNQNDSWIFALAVLLSSTFVYNSMGTINQQALEQLHYVTELTDRIRVKSSSDASTDEESADFVSFFPDFVWTVRDFYLDLDVNGQSITADQYLENSLKLIPGTDQKAKNFNLSRLCIRKFFPNKKCFIFDRPAHRKKLASLQTLHDDELEPEFLQQVREFCSFIFSQSKIKTLSGGIKVNGPRLESLVLTYVNAISSGGLPCMENAVLALAQIENTAAVKKAVAHYEQQMNKKVQLPTETLQELLDLHKDSEREAIEVFMKNSFQDVDYLFQKELANLIKQKLDDFCRRNWRVSTDCCSALLQNLFSPLEEEVKQGIYSKPGGYRLFLQKINELKTVYLQTPKKGIQAEEILQEYLRSKDSMMDAILQTDQTLTEKEKEIEVERVKAESAQASAKMLEEMQRKNQQMLDQKEKSYKEHVQQLTEKMERERAQLMAEQQRALTAKLQEQAKLLKEGFLNESRQLQTEIQNLRMSPQPICARLETGQPILSPAPPPLTASPPSPPALRHRLDWKLRFLQTRLDLAQRSPTANCVLKPGPDSSEVVSKRGERGARNGVPVQSYLYCQDTSRARAEGGTLEGLGTYWIRTSGRREGSRGAQFPWSAGRVALPESCRGVDSWGGSVQESTGS
ncbi:guanylate-binding protein 2-like [Rhynchocyon petersi]